MLASLFYKAVNIWNFSLKSSAEREGDVEIEDDDTIEKKELGEKTPDLDEDIFRESEDDFAFAECF